MNFGTSLNYNRPGVNIERYANDKISWETSHLRMWDWNWLFSIKLK